MKTENNFFFQSNLFLVDFSSKNYYNGITVWKRGGIGRHQCDLHGAVGSNPTSCIIYVGVSELEYEMVSKTIALSVRVQIPLPTPKFIVR